MVRTLIVGTGDMALGLCRQFGMSHTKGQTVNDEEMELQPKQQGHHSLQITSFGLHSSSDMGAFHETGVPFVDFDQGMASSDAIILAIPSSAIKDFLTKNFESIKDKIIVDITNPIKKGQNVPSALEELYKSHGIDYGVYWVKAFNDVGALDLITRKATDKKELSTIICGNSAQAVDTVKIFAQQALGFDKIKILPHPNFVMKMEESQGTIGWEWIHTFWIMMFIHACAYAYIAVRVHKGFGVPRANMPAYTMNRAFGSTALTGFAFTQVPGVFANLLRAFGGRSAKFPQWLLWSLAIRKHMGLASFFALAAHAILSCLLLSPVYHTRFFDPITNRLLLYPELSFLFATLGFCSYAVCAIASLPSAGAAMNYKQWDFVFGKFIWLALSFGTLHPVLLGVKGWKDQSSRPLNLPSPTLMSSVIPFTVMAAKLIQVLLCTAYFGLRRLSRSSKHGKATNSKASFYATNHTSEHSDE